MVFSSIVFAFYFLPIFLAGYLLVAGRARNALGNIWLLLASLVFYTWGETTYIVLLTGLCVLNYAVSLGLASFTGVARRTLLLAGVGANLGLLAYYKYAGFFAETAASISVTLGGQDLVFQPPPLPLGISFFVFHSLSYLLDVYHRDAPVERNFFYLALYMSMFPQLVAGPIVRFATVAHQLRDRRHTLDGAARGAWEFVLGLAQKALIANNMATVADAVFGEDPSHLSPAAAWFGAVAYALQIYFDFSGYSHMAIGLGRICGFTFPENFNFPYVAQSITDFWRRWHLSLSTWFRDYLYIPLGGNRHGPWRTAFNLFTVFFLCGLWHGASWSFVVWGLFHGAMLSLERFGWGAVLTRLPRPLRHSYALVTVLIGWVLFRADTLTYATHYLQTMFGLLAESDYRYDLARFFRLDLALIGMAAILFSGPWMLTLNDRVQRALAAGTLPKLAWECSRALTVVGLLWACVISLGSGSHNPFIYFRF